MRRLHTRHTLQVAGERVSRLGTHKGDRWWCHVGRAWGLLGWGFDSREQQGSSSEQALPLPHLAARTEEAARTADPTGRRSDGSMFGYGCSWCCGWRCVRGGSRQIWEVPWCWCWCWCWYGQIATAGSGSQVRLPFCVVSPDWEGTLLPAQARPQAAGYGPDAKRSERLRAAVAKPKGEERRTSDDSSARRRGGCGLWVVGCGLWADSLV